VTRRLALLEVGPAVMEIVMASEYTGKLPEGQAVSVRVEGDRIAALSPRGAGGRAEPLPYLLPVLVDLQHNGGLGAYYCDLGPDGVGNFAAIARHLRNHGVGRAWLTLVTRPAEALRQCARLWDDWLLADADLAALFVGVFHEGVFISPQDGWRGAHRLEWVEPPNYDRVRELDGLTGGRILMVNVAPEEPGGLEFVSEAVADGKLVALGHCCPSADVVAEAVARGARFVTHFGNGAAPMVHRFRNPFWSFLAHPELTVSLICDGHHLPPDLVRAALACKGREKCLPISDVSGYGALPPGDYDLPNGNGIRIESDGLIHLRDSELLAGGWFQEDRCVEFLVQHADFSLVDAWHQCSRVPAAAVGMALPEIEVGQEASFVLAHWDDGLVIDQAVHQGEAYLERPVRPADPGDALGT